MTTVGGALRARIVETGLLNQRVFRGSAPAGATKPYATFLDPVSLVPYLSGDAKVAVRSREVQVSLWQSTKDESDALLTALVEAIDGAQLDTEDGRKVWAARVTQLVRVDDPDELVVHHAVTVTIRHQGL